ncbi:TIGR04351 family putative TOMM peptide [Phytohabitans sp. ZYX-F-186]|uniref:TIGR04351 family putative TOMM peptide n=1 Tax=Phytohabitans maris TaxID=3071409 RepID=A0ABU0ZB13_9ACTN|nr:TIGR04351 family putative TOMM peptide [Phytohabitans sp. ZYX-F-186]MDQ7904163.1 TIGR04351 family putative TOMM peptide [Phytohabitans sp. ZYX-F-186]
MASIPAEHRARFARLIADAWSDPDVAARYEREPVAVLAEYGIVLDGDSAAPELPPAPGDVAVEDLGVSAGAAMATIGTVSCPGSCIGLS